MEFDSIGIGAAAGERVLVEETETHLEMTSWDQLRPGRETPTPVDMDYLPTPFPLLPAIYRQVGSPYYWPKCTWTDAEWQQWASRPEVRAWIARVNGKVVGLLILDLQRGNDAEIVAFGLIPEFVGKGFGGGFLTIATRLGWNTPQPDGAPTQRVWLRTCSNDHPHALQNYRRRGFVPFKTELLQRDIPDFKRHIGTD